jgi:hypothetical protein
LLAGMMFYFAAGLSQTPGWRHEVGHGRTPVR